MPKLMKKGNKWVVVGEEGQEADAIFEGELFDQQDLNRLLADNKRTLQRENTELKSKLTEMEKEWESLENTIQELAEEEGIDLDDVSSVDEDDDDDTSTFIDRTPNKSLKAIERRYNRQIEALKKQIDEEKSARVTEVERRRNSERDRILSEALSEIGVVDMDASRKIFMDRTFWDEDSENWLYRTKDGLEMDIQKGVADEMPDFLKIPSTTRSGSGTRPIRGGAGMINQQIEQKKLQLQNLQEQAKKDGANENTMTQIVSTQRELAKLSSQAKGPSAGTK